MWRHQMDREFLYREYVAKNRTAKEIAKEIGKSDTQVRYWIKKHGLPMKPRGGGGNTIDLTNKQFGELTAVKQVKGEGDCAKWECRCSCGNLHIVKSPCLRRGEIKSCGKCLEHYNWQGHGEMSGHYFACVRNNARRRSLTFKLTKKFLWDLFLVQKRLCALSGLTLYFARSYGATEQTASLDRIDSSKGYVETNVQWVHKDVNRIKREYSEDQFLKYVKLISYHLNL